MWMTPSWHRTSQALQRLLRVIFWYVAFRWYTKAYRYECIYTNISRDWYTVSMSIYVNLCQSAMAWWCKKKSDTPWPPVRSSVPDKRLSLSEAPSKPVGPALKNAPEIQWLINTFPLQNGQILSSDQRKLPWKLEKKTGMLQRKKHIYDHMYIYI